MSNIIPLYRHDLQQEVTTLLRHTASFRELLSRKTTDSWNDNLWSLREALLETEITLGAVDSAARLRKHAPELAVDLTTVLSELSLRSEHPVEYRAASHLAVSLLLMERMSEVSQLEDQRFLRAQWNQALQALGAQILILEVSTESADIEAAPAEVLAA